MSAARENPQAELHPIFEQRWSPRAFDAHQSVNPDDLLRCLEAARWAPSCFGEEPWRFIICNKASHPDAWQALLQCLAPKNQEWAQNAPVLMLATAAQNFSHNGNANRWAAYDAGQATMSLCLQASELGFITHQMGGFDVDAVTSAFNIPNDITPIAAIALGYQADAQILNDGFQAAELTKRSRKPLASRFFHGTWNYA